MDKLKELLKNRKATYVEKTPNDVYRDVAASFDQFSPEDIAAIGGLESQHGKFDSPLAGGSARGLFQFQPATAEGLIEGSSESLDDYNTQSDLMKEYLKKNEAEDLEDAYTKHNLGKSGARKFLAAEDEDAIRALIKERVRRANPGLYNVKTAGEARERIRKKLEEGKQSSKIRPNFEDIFKE